MLGARQTGRCGGNDARQDVNEFEKETPYCQRDSSSRSTRPALDYPMVRAARKR